MAAESKTESTKTPDLDKTLYNLIISWAKKYAAARREKEPEVFTPAEQQSLYRSMEIRLNYTSQINESENVLASHAVKPENLFTITQEGDEEEVRFPLILEAPLGVLAAATGNLSVMELFEQHGFLPIPQQGSRDSKEEKNRFAAISAFHVGAAYGCSDVLLSLAKKYRGTGLCDQVVVCRSNSFPGSEGGLHQLTPAHIAYKMGYPTTLGALLVARTIDQIFDWKVDSNGKTLEALAREAALAAKRNGVAYTAWDRKILAYRKLLQAIEKFRGKNEFGVIASLTKALEYDFEFVYLFLGALVTDAYHYNTAKNYPFLNFFISVVGDCEARVKPDEDKVESSFAIHILEPLRCYRTKMLSESDLQDGLFKNQAEYDAFMEELIMRTSFTHAAVLATPLSATIASPTIPASTPSATEAPLPPNIIEGKVAGSREVVANEENIASEARGGQRTMPTSPVYSAAATTPSTQPIGSSTTIFADSPSSVRALIDTAAAGGVAGSRRAINATPQAENDTVDDSSLSVNL